MSKLCMNTRCILHNIRCSMNVWILVVLLVSSLANSHVIHKRHGIIENHDSSEHLTVDSETPVGAEPESPQFDDGQLRSIDASETATDVMNNDESNNVNNVQGGKVPTSTDVNNGIEQSFGSHANHNAPNISATIDLSNTNTNLTKDFSQESIENRLPSKSSNKAETTEVKSVVPLKDEDASDEGKLTQSTPALPSSSSNLSDKPKRTDASFIRSTERAVPDFDSSTIPISRSTASILSTVALTPRISATETIRARISSISPEVIAEKRAKYLSEPHIGSSSPSSVSDAEASWSDLKTVGEVHYNNVTLGKSATPEESIKSVNGKLDSEEVPDKGSLFGSATERSTEEHETQLQKSNSSRIFDVYKEDNSLSSFQPSTNQPIVPVTKRTGPSKSTVIGPIHQVTQKIPLENTELESSMNKSNLENPRKENAKSAVNLAKVIPGAGAAVSSTERIIANDDEETTIKTTDKEIYSTTEEEEQTTATVDDSETTIVDEITTVINVPKLGPTKNAENIPIDVTTTLFPTTDENEVVHTTDYIVPVRDETNNKPHESTESVIPNDIPINTTDPIETNSITISTVKSTTTPLIAFVTSTSPSSTSHVASSTPSISTETTDSVTHEVTHPLIHSTKSITSKPTQTNQKIIIPNKQTEHPDVQHDYENVSSTTEPTHKTSAATETAPVSISPRINPVDGSGLDTQKDAVNRSTTPPEHQTEIDQVPDGKQTDVNAMIAIGISVVAIVTLILLVGFLFVMRKRQKQLTYGQRCRPIGLDAYSLDNISVYNSVRRKSAIRTSKRAFGNAGFDDPGLKNNSLNISQLAIFSQKRVTINDEFRDIPTVTARIEEVPVGCEDKNRYANVVPLPESRVHLKRLDDDEKTEYINANFVKGPKDTTHYYIACQAPLEHTVIDFWRMIWEQNSRVIIMATDLTENGIEKCAEYLPSSFVIDNHVTFGDYQIILKNRDVRDKYAVSTVHLKNACTKTWREITHFWYQWPENGVPNDEASFIAMLLEARSFLKMITPEQKSENGKLKTENAQQESDFDENMSNGNLDKTKSLQRIQGPLTVHCSPGTGRTGTIIACDIAIRSLEQPARTVDVPQIVYFVRRGRASAVQTREQYEFIYKVSHVYATKLTGPATDN